MQKLPQITFWKERITPGHVEDSISMGDVYACHARRNWDVPSNGVFLLFTREELWGRDWASRRDWRAELEAALKARERRLVSEYQRRVRHHLADYFDDEIWVPT